MKFKTESDMYMYVEFMLLKSLSLLCVIGCFAMNLDQEISWKIMICLLRM